MTRPRILCRALVAVIIAIVPGKWVWGQERPARKLDREVEQLIAQGCSAGSRNVIITVQTGYRQGLGDSLKAHGDKVKSEFASIDALAAEVHCDDLADLARMPTIASLSIDGPMQPHGWAAGSSTSAATRKLTALTQAQAAAALKAPLFESLLAWPQLRTASASTFTDARMKGVSGGIGVAVIDSGITPGPEFANRITAFYDFSRGDIRVSPPVDPYGHGTHVAGLIAGANVGVAPNARLVGLRVLDGSGRGSTSDVIRAIEFAIVNKAALNLHVINLSLGHPIYEMAATDPLVRAVENAVRHGLVVSVSAGNFGINPSTGLSGYAGVASPGNAPSAITSGSTNMFDTVTRHDDRVSVFSSRGPTWYDGLVKPDVVSPGESVLSVAAEGSRLRSVQEARGNTGEYMRLSGTSMAAAVTSGVIALTIDVNPKLTPNTVKAILQYSAIPVLSDASGPHADALTQGAGQINGGGAFMLARAITADAPVGSKWLAYQTITPITEIGGQSHTWTQSILWGRRRVSGLSLMELHRPAWAVGTVWGNALNDDNIVWGNLNDDNIVWGNGL